MREYGIDISGRRSKHLDTFAGQRFGYVISLCDRIREVCPAFRRVAAELRTRIGFLLARIGHGE